MREEIAQAAEEIGTAARARGLRVGAAESLTSGAIASALGRAEAASEWFGGSVVAYSMEAKNRLLGVPVGPVVTAACAEAMAAGVVAAGVADVAVAVTGVGGPGGNEGHPPGTVFVGVATAEGVRSAHHRFHGEPAEVVEATTLAALRYVGQVLAAR